MNMFKSRRKAKEQSDALEALTNGQTPTSTTFKSVKNLKRKNKPIPEDSKPTFDLTSVLPDDNDFRTSLLMPNLSARFSMLREQDDPNTKIGKASDDSVLFPKRASRLNLFHHTTLADVAEVESVYSTFRPPFADRDRANSLGDGYESDGGSVMSRSRPGEGNNLFGGRQKIYKVNTTATRNAAASNAVTSSKHVYEADVSLSRFQQYKLREKEAQLADQENRSSVPVTDGDNSEVASPATGFSRNRGTQSSTNSGPRRSSTAATSVASDQQVLRNSSSTPDGATVQAYDSVSQAPETHSSLLVSKKREDTIPNRFASPPKGIVTDRTNRSGAIFTSTPFRNASSPVTPMSQPLDFGFKTESRSTSATGRYQTDSPIPNPISEVDHMLAHNLQPNDHGKATAMGVFHKPIRDFDEEQYAQRQLQMHEGQISSLHNDSRSASRASQDAQKTRQSSASVASYSNQTSDNRVSAPQVPPIPSTSASPVPNSNRASKASGRSSPPRPRSKSSVSATATANMKARVESMIRKSNAEFLVDSGKSSMPGLRNHEDPSEDKENFTGTFFDNDDEDESDFEGTQSFIGSRAASSKIDESDIHPAFRNSYRVSDTHTRRSNYSNFSKTRSVLDDEHRESSTLRIPAIDTDLTVQSNGPGLSGLIRTHLRRDSDRSSIMPRPESSVTPNTAGPSARGSIASTAKTTADSLRSDPFDLDLAKRQSTTRLSQVPPTPNTVMSEVAQQFLSRAMAMRDGAENDRTVHTADIDVDDEPRDKSWHDDMEPRHQRGESSETTKERREFDDELAERRRKIREGLKSVTERDRSQSPGQATRGQSVTLQAFVQQRAVTDPQPKTLKMLGLQSKVGMEDERGFNKTSRSDLRARAGDNEVQNATSTPYSAPYGPDSVSDRQHPPRSATPPAIRYGPRGRSASNVSDQAKSRGRYKENNPPLPGGLYHLTNRNQPPTSPRDEPSPFNQLNMRNGHRGAKSPPLDVMTAFPVRGSPRPSPISPQSSYESGNEGARQSPVPHSSGRTTPSSGRMTPTSMFSRKRSVTKTMISEPKFLSSTSSVPLVHLPDAHQNYASAPPVPTMNPRRRGNTTGEKPVLSPTGLAFARSTPLEPVPASPIVTDFSEATGKASNSPSPRKLRKANSEGGSMAAKARQQAMAAELAREQTRSPTLPVFPNRSATALVSSSDNPMF